MSRKVSQEIKQEIIEYYLNKPVSLKEVAKKFHLCNPTVGKILKDYPKYTRTQIFSPQIQERWFEKIDSEEKAYYLGLFITDGNVCFPTRGGQANNNLTLSVQDEYLLKKWLELIGSDRKLAYDGRGCAQAACLSDLMAEDLAQYGIIARKTDVTYLPILDKELMPHLIRGILDGDGSVEAKWHTAKDGRRRFKHAISFCGSHQLMQDLFNYFSQNLSFQVMRKIYDYQAKNLSEFKISNYHDIQVFGNWIYENATIYMLRKKEKYDLIIERINNMATLC